MKQRRGAISSQRSKSRRGAGPAQGGRFPIQSCRVVVAVPVANVQTRAVCDEGVGVGPVDDNAIEVGLRGRNQGSAGVVVILAALIRH